ncbi:hypothetical protein CO051_00090 [Candidatus Roizmanbacteria bacterium CG_4_9_14_0_2_um_filter_39_13]|uniref:Uncharacterized protein n=1 Tax=Candidatus Roizmanbacteria bacterium CG_4_9_14_0_2_um_filter_39_13 TaxID=1974839 RepID=A0A2M8F4S0_9BACT|nr:MAG: hypothetical protein COY15_04620 [Candidatus Roizmanbacteria bacterium CG_4_10_14_0_2_um_filter_39_12]PJC34303.1 MAG: hypothetical protein CO051_00090 [Candidatus Roizmanbacteria bacterium CG_4_9_14_0_2_um_filter_39_13]
MDRFKNLYEVKKTVRFELKPSRKKIFEGGDVIKLLKDFKKVQRLFLEIFVYKKKDSKLEFKKKREIKYTWLRTHTKNEFYNWSRRSDIEKNYVLSKIDFLPEEILRWLDEWQKLTESLEDITQTEEHKQKRKSNIAFALRKFSKRQNLPFIKDFFNAVIDIQGKQGNESDVRIKEFRGRLKEIEKNFNACSKKYLPTQSNGVLLHKASFNYYTLNKTPKEYEDLKKEKELELNGVLSWAIYKRERVIDRRTEQTEILFDCDIDWLKKIGLGDEIQNWVLDEAYQKMKIWKANQKSDFIEAVARDKLTFQNFRKKFPLFDASDENFEICYKLTKELDKKPKDAKKVAQERGKFFNAPKEKIQTKNYFELCELYKRIALKRGKIIAEIKGIENEEVQSQLLTHYAMVAEEENKKFIVFIPRKNGEELENHKNAHKFLQGKEKKESGDVKVYHFKSLTLRALEKLCFKKTKNTFAPEIEKETNPKIWFPKYKQQWNKTPEKLIEFYKKVLQSDYSKKYLDLVDFGNLNTFLKTDFTTLEEFESVLEKTCYTKVPVYFSKKEFETFKDEFEAEVFEITTRSVSTGSARKENAHAKIWKDFWSRKNETAGHTIRLNPEVSIFYRDEIKEMSNASRQNRTSDVNNRFSDPRFTLATTITTHADKKKPNLAFKKIEDIKNHIDSFNTVFNRDFSGVWVYGIDRGLKELATLNVVKFSDVKNKFGVLQPKEFAKISIYKLSDEKAILKDVGGKSLKNAKGEDRKVIDNISEVLEEGKEPDPILFENRIVSSIDLTQAKLIKGHIITNGDQKTYLKLKETSAKRRIFELFSNAQIDKNTTISGNKTIMLGKNNTIYWLCEWQRQNPWRDKKESLMQSLKDYLQNLDIKNHFKDIETIEQINHLRDSITANMVGLLFHLQNKLKIHGVIALENLDTVQKKSDSKMIDEHFEQSNEDISRRLEWALYRKFANTGEVPPQIKESIFLRGEFKVCQMGILKFVEVGGTSRGCPNCQSEWNQECGNQCNPKCNKCTENDSYKKNKRKNVYICKDDNQCKFSTEESRNLLEQNLHNSDDVAAYNIAKRGLEINSI